MTEIGAPLVGFYDYRLVALSVFIAISASYSALDLGGRVTAARGWIRSAWLAGGAVAMGLGIWSMHFTGMLAFNLPVPVFYDWPTVLLSLLTAILSSAVALYVVSRKKMGRVQALTGSIFMGLGIAGMHYIGMAAMRLSAICQYSPPLVVLSALIGVIASLVAIQLTFDYREDFRGTMPAKVISAVVMGAAIVLMHYTGMWSASFLTTTAIPDMAHAVSVSSLGLSGIVLGTLVVQGVAIVTSSVDRRFARQAEELQTSERFRQIAENLEIVLALANANFTELLYVNRTYHDIWGRTLESFYAEPMSFLEGIHAEDRERVAERVQRLIGGEPIDNLECRVVRPDGSISWIACRGYPIHDAQGHVYRLVGSAREITKRRQAEEALRSSEWEQRQLAEQLKGERARLVEAQEVAKIGSWEAELPSLNVIWSEQIHQIFETDPSVFYPTRTEFREFIHQEDRAKVDAASKPPSTSARLARSNIGSLCRMAESEFSRSAGKFFMMKKESRFVSRGLVVTSPNVCEPRTSSGAFLASFCGYRTRSGARSRRTCTTLRGKISSHWPQCLVSSEVQLLWMSANHARLFLNA